MAKTIIDTESNEVVVVDGEQTRRYPLDTAAAFDGSVGPLKNLAAFDLGLGYIVDSAIAVASRCAANTAGSLRDVIFLDGLTLDNTVGVISFFENGKMVSIILLYKAKLC